MGKGCRIHSEKGTHRLRNPLNTADTTYEASLRKQIVDRSSNDKRGVRTVLGGLRGNFLGRHAAS